MNMLDYSYLHELRDELERLKLQVGDCNILRENAYAEYFCFVRGDDQESMFMENRNMMRLFQQINDTLEVIDDMVTIFDENYKRAIDRKNEED